GPLPVFLYRQKCEPPNVTNEDGASCREIATNLIFSICRNGDFFKFAIRKLHFATDDEELAARIIKGDVWQIDSATGLFFACVYTHIKRKVFGFECSRKKCSHGGIEGGLSGRIGPGEFAYIFRISLRGLYDPR